MIKNIIIGSLVLVIISFLYVFVIIPRGESVIINPETATIPNLKTYTSEKFGISFEYPEGLKIEENTGLIKVSGDKVDIQIADKRNASVHDYVKLEPGVHSINIGSTEHDHKHIIIEHQTASPESYSRNVYIKDYPDGPFDEGDNKHIIILDASEEQQKLDGMTDTTHPTTNYITRSLRFIK